MREKPSPLKRGAKKVLNLFTLKRKQSQEGNTSSEREREREKIYQKEKELQLLEKVTKGRGSKVIEVWTWRNM